MPSRHLPEVGRARQQRDLSVERRLRFLARRTRYPSVSRSAFITQVNTNTASTEVYVSLTIDRGIWLVLASVNVRVETVLTQGTEEATMTLLAYSVETGDPLGTVLTSRWRRDGGTTRVREQISAFVHYEAQERTRLDMRINLETDGIEEQVQLHNLQIIAIPL